MEARVTLNTAQLAKEKGFQQKGSKCWVQLLSGEVIHNDDREDILEHERAKYYLSQPTQQVLATWLLEKHRYFVSIELAYNEWGRYSAKIEKLSKDGKTAILALDGLTIFDNPYNAWEEGLYETLKLI